MYYTHVVWSCFVCTCAIAELLWLEYHVVFYFSWDLIFLELHFFTHCYITRCSVIWKVSLHHHSVCSIQQFHCIVLFGKWIQSPIGISSLHSYMYVCAFSRCLVCHQSVALNCSHKCTLLLQCNLNYPDLVYPEPRLPGIAPDPANTLVRMRRGCAQLSLRGVATVAWHFYRVVLAKTGWPVYLYECCWLWSCYICIVYRLGIINQVRKVGTLVIQTISLIRYASNQTMDKGVRIIKVALYLFSLYIFQNKLHRICSV